MTELETPPEPSSGLGPTILRVVRGLLLHVAIPAVVVYAGWRGAEWLLDTAPRTERQARPRTARPVEVVRAERVQRGPTVQALGVVKAARETTIRSRVAGPVLRVGSRFTPGGVVRTGETLVEIDPKDFDLAVTAAKIDVKLAEAGLREARGLVEQRRTALDDARASLRLEEGLAEVARRELEMLGEGGRRVDRDLVLRIPQLARANAAVDAAAAGVAVAEAALGAAEARVAAAEHRVATAEIDRTRTTIVAPFAAWVAERRVEEGGYLTTTTDVARLVGTDAYHIEVLVPVSDLPWIVLPDADGPPGESNVVVRDPAAWGPDGTRHGRLLRWLGDLEEVGRMARLIVEVADPLQRDPESGAGRPLLLGSVVRVALPGRPLPSAIALDRVLLRHGNAVWIAAPDDTLEIRHVEVAWRGPEQVLVTSGLDPGDRIVVTDLGTPVAGMGLKVTEPGASR